MTISIDKIQGQAPVIINQVTRPKSTSNFQYIPRPFIKVARGMERQYAKFMIDQMNKTIHKSESNSNGQSYYKSLLDNKRIDVIVRKNEGLGLQKVILDQIYPQKFRNKLAYSQFQKSTNKPKRKIDMIGPKQIMIKYNTNENQYGPKVNKEIKNENY